jgi:hypothetical protein
MEGLRFIGIALAGLLSFEMPVYAARAFGAEDRLNQIWNTGLNDTLPAQILAVTAYMLAGFLIWAAPAALVIGSVHPQTGPRVRALFAPVVRILAAPFRPLQVWLTNRWDAWSGELAERSTIKSIYEKEFAGQFASFAQFRRYYRWLNDQNYIDPREPLTASSDKFADAVAFLGLPEGFDQKALAARFGLLMKQVHPDIAGPNDIARRLTDAREILKARKGWK